MQCSHRQRTLSLQLPLVYNFKSKHNTKLVQESERSFVQSWSTGVYRQDLLIPSASILCHDDERLRVCFSLTDQIDLTLFTMCLELPKEKF